MDDLRGTILDYVINEYIEDKEKIITYDTPLITGGYIDSFSMVSLLVFIQNKFKITIPDDQATPDAFDSVNKIVDLISKRRKQISTNYTE